LFLKITAIYTACRDVEVGIKVGITVVGIVLVGIKVGITVVDIILTSIVGIVIF
jgi:hypothetical protein